MSKNEDSEHSIDDSAAVESTVDGDEHANVVVRLHGNDDLLCSLNEMASSLCSTCREFNRGQIEINGGDTGSYRVYHSSLESLHDSIDAGCCICKCLSQSLDRFCKQYGPPSTPTELWSIRCHISWHPLWRMSVNSSHNPFQLRYFLWVSDCYYPATKFPQPKPFVTLDFFPADCLGLGPEFLGMPMGEQV
jgi:hypothetical protein